MRILSIETSCDDTAITMMEALGGIQNATFRILANSTNSQIEIHRPHGGVFPMLAKREHMRNLPILLDKVLHKAENLSLRSLSQGDSPRMSKFRARNYATSKGQNFPPVDLITVTSGPGLEPALWAGIIFAKELGKKWNVPIIPVNHMEGHVLSIFGKDKGNLKVEKLKMPILSLLVSGGHTELVLTKKWMNYEIIGQTVDDAVGEAFDKVARMLDLPYPGGPEISKLAEEARNSPQGRTLGIQKGPTFSRISLPRPMLHSKNFDFSFSGLKTAVLYLIRDLKKEDPNILENDKIKMQIALEFENAAIESLTHKTNKALEKYKIKTLIVGGGVSANKHLQKELKKIAKDKKIKLFLPKRGLSADNSIMIGIAGYLNYIKNKKKVPKISSIKADGNLRLK